MLVDVAVIVLVGVSVGRLVPVAVGVEVTVSVGNAVIGASATRIVVVSARVCVPAPFCTVIVYDTAFPDTVAVNPPATRWRAIVRVVGAPLTVIVRCRSAPDWNKRLLYCVPVL